MSDTLAGPPLVSCLQLLIQHIYGYYPCTEAVP